MSISLSPNMSLPVPGVGTEAGPQYATDVNNCLTILDAHDHAPGSGVQITPDGLNINADLSFASNNGTNLRTIRFVSQNNPLAGASDIGCLYEVMDDLYYNDGAGNQVRITQSGGVAGTPGSIANLTSPASASYVSADATFVWQSAALTPANMDAAAYIFRNLTASSFGLTVQPPTLSSDYTITLPALPGSTLPLVITSSGVMSASQITLAQLAPAVQTAIAPGPPTIQTFLTGSGTYTTPADIVYIRVKAVGGGGGGSGAGGVGAAGTGGTTTFGTSLITCVGGSGGAASGVTGSAGGAGGSATAVGLSGTVKAGGSGNGGGSGTFPNGGGGAASPFGGAGGGGAGNNVGQAAIANTGSGGGGGGGTNTGGNGGAGGGGAGGYVDVIIPSPGATYAYAIGAAGTFTGNGNNGGSGYIEVTEYRR